MENHFMESFYGIILWNHFMESFYGNHFMEIILWNHFMENYMFFILWKTICFLFYFSIRWQSFYGKLYVFFITWLHHGNRILGMTKYLIGLRKQDIQRRVTGRRIRNCERSLGGKSSKSDGLLIL